MIIKMAHGSGGKETEELVKSVFMKYFSDEKLRRMEDAAVVELNGRSAFTTDSFVVTPLFFKGGDIGRLSVCGTVNDLLMMGAVPKYLSAGFIIEEGMDSETLEKIASSMSETAKEAGVSIVAGDTKVVEGKGGLYINTAGIGSIPEGRNISPLACEPGDAIIISGNLGDHHACILSARMKIDNNIVSDAAPLNKLVGALFENGVNVKAMRDITRGGLATVLSEICGASGTGALIEENAVPVAEQTAAFCAILGLDPMYMGNEGKFVSVVSREDSDKALSVLKKLKGGEDAAIAGYIRSQNGVSLKTRLGGTRILGPLYGEGLPRIC